MIRAARARCTASCESPVRRGLRCLLLALTLGASTGVAAQDGATPHASDTPDTSPRIVSTNLCADQLLLRHADPAQILSLSTLSRDPAASRYPTRAMRYPVNDGLAESAIARAPDLVIVGEHGRRHATRLMRDAGLRVETLPIANTLDEMLDNLRLVGSWIGREARVAAEIARLETRIATVDERRAARATSSPRRALVLDANGYTAGPGSLRDELVTRAGWRSVAAERELGSYGSLPLETLVSLTPDLLMESPYRPDAWSRAQALLSHPAWRDRTTRRFTVASRDVLCAGPWTVGLLETLADVLDDATAPTATSPASSAWELSVRQADARGIAP